MEKNVRWRPNSICNTFLQILVAKSKLHRIMWPNLHSPFNFLITISVDSLITKVWKCLVFSNTKNFQICNGNSVINAGCVCFYSRLLNLNSFYRLPLTCFLSFDFVFLITSIFSLITVFICLFTFCMCCCYCKSIVWWRRLKRKKKSFFWMILNMQF